MGDPRNIGIGPAGRAFMGALLRLHDALQVPGQEASDRDGSGEAGETGTGSTDRIKGGGR